MTRSILIATALSNSVRGEQVATTIFVIYRTPHSTLNGGTPFFRLYYSNTDLSPLRAIGAKAFIHSERHSITLDKREYEGRLEGTAKTETWAMLRHYLRTLNQFKAR